MFLGSLLEQILGTIEAGKVLKATEAQIIDLGVSQIPTISKDYTDRNRTSPFAFTGNKFEFRAVGSTANVAVPMTILNAAVADAFKACTERLKTIMKSKTNRDEAVMELVRQVTVETKAIRFDGNGYSDDWKIEAKRRGLPILNTTVDALAVMNDRKQCQFLIDTHVLSAEEITSRYHISVERYIKTLDLEHDTLIELLRSFIFPTLDQQARIFEDTLRASSSDSLKKAQQRRRSEFEKLFTEVLENFEDFATQVEQVRNQNDEHARMRDIVAKLQPAASKLRNSVDQIEPLVSDKIWPLPKYREMLLANLLT